MFLRLAAAASVAVFFAAAADSAPAASGLSTFGNPPELALLWTALAIGLPLWLLATTDRLALAQRLTLILMVGTLLEGRLIPANGAWLLVLLAITGWAAKPFLQDAGFIELPFIVILFNLPTLKSAEFGYGAVLWFINILPIVWLAQLIPSLFYGINVRQVVRALVLATTAACTAALATYPVLASGLHLPLLSTLGTRLHLLGIHPNLAVPHLVIVLLLGAGLCWETEGKRRQWWFASLLPILGALFLVNSRTGFVAAALAFGAAILASRPGVLARRLWIGASLGVVLAMIVPATTLLDESISNASNDSISRAVSFRSAMWELGRDSMEAAPWNGHGPGTYYEQAAVARPGRFDGMPKDDHPHSVLLAVGGAFGWPGLVALAVLVCLSLRPPRQDRPWDSLFAASLLALWGMSSIDMGGAVNSLYPSLAFLLLGLRAATALKTPEPSPDSGLLRWLSDFGPLKTVFFLSIGLFQVYHTTNLKEGALLVDRLQEPAAFSTTRSTDIAHADSILSLADRFNFGNPAPSLHRSRLAVLRGDFSGAMAYTDEALAEFPRSAGLTHRWGLLAAEWGRQQPRQNKEGLYFFEESVEAFERSVALDPTGPTAWRRHLDLCRARAKTEDEAGTLEALVSALLIRPSEVGSLPRENAVLYPAGRDFIGIPLETLLKAIQAQRQRFEDIDPPYAARFAVREVEILLSLELYDEAKEAAQEVLKDQPIYLATKLAVIAEASGNFEEAAGHWTRSNEIQEGMGMPWTFGNRLHEVCAQAKAGLLDRDDFETRVSEILEQPYDAVFDNPYLKKLLQTWKDLEEGENAATLAQALAFAER